MYSQSLAVEARGFASFLYHLTPKFVSESSDYTIVAQDATEVKDRQNAPAISMGPFLIASGQMDILPAISIYKRHGYDRRYRCLLYMNAAALRVWKAMGKHPKQIGVQYRPPQSAVLTFGMPFPE
jgi:hypothetical protein